MFTQQDIDLVRAAIVKNCAPAEQPFAHAVLNMVLHVGGLAERFVIAQERIANAKGSMPPAASATRFPGT